MNQNKICIAIFYEDEMVLESCIDYINQQFIEERFELELFTIFKEKNYFSAIRECIEATDAKYKLFIQSNVFCLYQEMIQKCVDIFEYDNMIGMIGIIGAKHVPYDCLFWKAYKNGHLLSANEQPDYSEYEYDIGEDGYSEMKLIDSCFFMTSCEFEIRDDLFSSNLLVGESIAMEIQKAGLKVIVPNQKLPWVASDNRYVTLKGYVTSRQLFFDEYSSQLF